MNSFGEFEKEEKIYQCPMTTHTENKVRNITSKFTYNILFCICKNLDRDSSKLKHLVSTSKTTIYSLEKEKKMLLKEIDRLKRIHNISI